MPKRSTEARRIGQNVRAARRASDLSIAVAAGLAGHSKSWLSKIENGKIRLEHRSDIAALAEALRVSADYLLGEPAPEIRPNQPNYNLLAMQRVLLDGSPTDPLDIHARPTDVLAAEVQDADEALRKADPATAIRLLTASIGELCVHVATGDERVRTEALRLLVQACGSETTHVLRQIGQTNLAWIAGERGHQAAELLGDPIWLGAAAFGRAHARSSTNRPRGLMVTPQIADQTEPHIGDDRFAHEVYGMLRLSAALACGVQEDYKTATEHVREAERLAARLGDRPGAWEVFGPSNVAVWRTSLAVEAKDATTALNVAANVTPEALPSRNRRASLFMERARADAMLGRDLDAVHDLLEAENWSAPQTRNNPMIKELVADLLPRIGGRDLRGLAWRMNLI